MMKRGVRYESTASVLLALSLSVLPGCGGGAGGGSVNRPPNPIPSVVTVSPNSSDQNAAAFTLSIVGSGFIPSSVARWNGSDRPTTFVSGNLLTVQISSSDTSTVGTKAVTVMNPTPGGGASNEKDFAVPCDIPSPAPPANQTRARVGAYFFDGWTGPLTNFHYNGLLNGDFKNREPLSGWQDSNPCSIEKQLATAHNFGIDFFIYEWYFNTSVTANGENLNSALQITHALPNRHGMQFAIMYVNGPPFDVPAASWTSAVDEWVSYMKDPAFVRVNGKPLFIVMNVGGMGSDARTALQQLRDAAIAQGLPGVYIVGGFGVPDGTIGQDSLNDGFTIAGNDGYDAVAFLGYPFAQPPISGVRPYSDLAAAGHWVWDQARLHSSVPFIPTAMDGWDPRPWDERSSAGILMWYSRTPQEVADFVSDAIAWTNSNPQLRPEPSPVPPLVFITSWNEMGEGNHMLPTVEDGTSYGNAIANMLTSP